MALGYEIPFVPRHSLIDASPALPALALSGRPACDGERARLALAPSQAGPGAPDLTASLEIDRGGAWRIEALARSDDAGLRLALAAAGFQEAPGGLSFVASGRLDD